MSSRAVFRLTVPPHQDEHYLDEHSNVCSIVEALQASGMLVKLAEAKALLSYQEQCFPHLSLLLSDALCLTSHPEVAADLILETFQHAARTFRDCRREQVPAQLSGPATLAWLRRIMHACFCQHCLGEAP